MTAGGYLGTRRSKYGWEAMVPGDDLFFAGLSGRRHGDRRPAMAAYDYAKRNGWKFAVRTEEDGIRIKRVA